jgi:hypothetical protein
MTTIKSLKSVKANDNQHNIYSNLPKLKNIFHLYKYLTQDLSVYVFQNFIKNQNTRWQPTNQKNVTNVTNVTLKYGMLQIYDFTNIL